MRVAFAIVAGVLAFSATGYAGGFQRPPYLRADLAGILDAAPVVRGWSFKAGDSYIFPIAHPPAFTLAELLRLGDSPTKAQRTLGNGLKKAGFVIGRHRTWDGEGPAYNTHSKVGAVAVFFAFLFRDASGAARGARLLRPTLPANTETRSLQAKELGPDSWGAYASGRTGNEQAAYLWRRTNLVILAFMDCHDGPCEEDPGKAFNLIQPAARTYADQIDARAKRKP